MCGTFPPARTSDLPRLRGSIPALLATPSFSAKALMKYPPIAIAQPTAELVSAADEGLVAFINTLRLSVKAKVAADQERGLSLSEIVVQVREMVRLFREDAAHPLPFPARAFRTISRQAIAWCVEAYRPVVFIARDELFVPPNQADQQVLPPAIAPAKASAGRFPAQSPPYRGLP